LRKPGAALLARPFTVVARVASLDPRGRTSRLLALGAAAAFTASLIVGIQPATIVAVPATDPVPVSANLFMPIGTEHAPSAPFTIAFDTAMDPASVAAALTIVPRTDHELRWDSARRVLTISPTDHWQPGTLHSIVIGRSAQGEDGGTLAAPLRSVVLTARAGSGELDATSRVGTRVRLDTAFSIRLDRELPVWAVRAALRTVPEVTGEVVAGDTPGSYTFQPHAPLKPDTLYRVWLANLSDGEHVPFEVLPVVGVRTVEAPQVGRIRPRDDSTKVKRSANLSVRFTEAMDEERTAAAYRVTANGKPVKGKVRWAEDGTVLVFDPAKALPYGAKVVQTVDLAARSRDGAPIERAVRATFRVVPRPEPADIAIPTGGGGAVAGSWVSVERYYLKLMNCTRTGGWVTSSGKCSSPGGRNVAPLTLSPGISSRVARPYARLLATRNLCSHFVGGSPGDRLRRAGYSSYRWAENIGCRSGGASGAVLATHMFYQSEKPWNGGHYRNMMNAAFTHTGIGVWVAGGRVRLVVDFYRP
jgi:hypothetical protein